MEYRRKRKARIYHISPEWLPIRLKENEAGLGTFLRHSEKYIS